MYPFERSGSLSGPGLTADDTTIVPANAIASQTTGHQRDDSGSPVGNRIRNSAMPAGQNTQSIQDCTQATGSTAGSEPGAVKMPRSAYCSARNSRQKSRLRAQKIQPSGCSGRRDAISAPTTANRGISRMTTGWLGSLPRTGELLIRRAAPPMPATTVRPKSPQASLAAVLALGLP